MTFLLDEKLWLPLTNYTFISEVTLVFLGRISEIIYALGLHLMVTFDTYPDKGAGLL